MQRVTQVQSSRIRELSSKLGERTLRQLLTPEGSRLISRKRLLNLEAGSGKLSAQDTRRLDTISRNSNELKALKKRGERKREFQTNRALRTWVFKGKGKDEKSSEMDQDNKLKVIRALGFLGVDPTDGTFYVRRQ